jgi:hypothetical protein
MSIKLLKILHISGTIGLSESVSPELEIAALKQNVSMNGVYNFVFLYFIV